MDMVAINTLYGQNKSIADIGKLSLSPGLMIVCLFSETYKLQQRNVTNIATHLIYDLINKIVNSKITTFHLKSIITT